MITPTHLIEWRNQARQSVLYRTDSLILIHLHKDTSIVVVGLAPGGATPSNHPFSKLSYQSAMTPNAANGLIGTGKRILELPHILRAYCSTIVPRRYIRSLKGYLSCAVSGVYSLTAMEVRPTTMRS